MYSIKKSKNVVGREKNILAAILEATERVEETPLRVVSENGPRTHRVAKVFKPVSGPITVIEYECGDQIGEKKEFENMAAALAVVKNCGDGETATFFQDGKTIMEVVAGR